jgi:polyribonucleotide nucleotidyltransferase
MKRSETVELGPRTLTLETGELAPQAAGAAVARLGDAMVLAAVTRGPAREANAGDDFVPLTVEYRERTAAAGRIPGGWGRREGRQGDHEVLTARLVDRALRPLLPEGFRDEVLVTVTVFGWEPGVDIDLLALNASAAALWLSDLPVSAPAAGVRVVEVNGELSLAADETLRGQATAEWFVAGTAGGLLMLEGGASGAEADGILGHLAAAEEAIAALVGAIGRLRGDAPRTHAPATTPSAADVASREAILAGRRPDGRAPADLRPVAASVGLLPSNHGSALFSRGDAARPTQALVSATVGTADDALTHEPLGGRRADRFLLHYNFPSFAVGEAKPPRGPGRREIGHGALARRALAPMLGAEALGTSTVRVVSDILSSNGSSSMATVCGASLALMDAGVGLREHVAGVAMGLVRDGDRWVTLTDLTADEDHLGDMDLKVAGTAAAITALQLDVKRGPVSREVIADALGRAQQALGDLVEVLRGVIVAPHDKHRKVPRAAQVRIPVARIGGLIGPGGKHVNELQTATNSRIEVRDDGLVRISAKTKADLAAAVERVEAFAVELAIGAIHRAEVIGIKDFGAVVRFGDHEGLVHVSELAAGRVEKAGDVVKVGEFLSVRVLGVDDRGRIKLSARSAAEG